MRRTLLAFSLALSIAGCTDNPTPDVGTEVFQTLPEAATDRRRSAIERWKAQAIQLVAADRPDVAAEPAVEEFAITIRADSVERTIDLEPAFKDLSGQMGRSQSILARHLEPSLARFDQDRLAALTFDQVRPRLRPLLVGREELEQINANFPSAATLLHATQVGAAGMHWMPVVRWGQSDAFAPIPPERLATWNVTQTQLDQCALDNLRREFSESEAFDTARFGPMGNVGALAAAAPAEVVLLPEFLAAVRRQWNTSDDLALMPAGRRAVRFIESKNTPLLDQFYPQWERMVQDTPQPLSRRVLLLSDKGIAPMNYNPPVELRQLSTSRPALPGDVASPANNNPPSPQSPLLNIKRPTTQPFRPQPGQSQRPYIAR